MEMQVIIRNAGEQDLDMIIELWKELMDFHKIRDQYFSRSSDGHEKFMEFISGHIASETSKVLVAEHDGNIVGHCLASISNYPPVFENKEYGSIDDLAVTESYRRTGVGEKLCQEIQKWFKEQKIQRIELRVAVTNEVSTSFWRKMGYRPYIEILYKEI
ncbi:MAG: GNAT family N-acetyltransferase [Desulfobacteraceae bacterium]|nr:GNAT family N-acetyltransferase [Desulfobacteraceae bacterium]